MTKRTEWRNVFWLSLPVEWDGETRGPGEYISQVSWPTLEDAIAVARENRPRWSALGAIYLGSRWTERE